MNILLKRIGRFRLGLIVITIILIITSWWSVLSARSGLIIKNLERDGVPMLYMVPEGADKIPGVLIAHGFGASNQIMRGYGFALAHAGYGVMLWDFDGHGRNPTPFNRTGGAIQLNLDSAYAELINQPEIDPSRIALLGHSMGGGAVLAAGIKDVERYQATIAVSASSGNVTADSPRNLFLQVGEWETGLVSRVEDTLVRAGGENDDFENGRARSLLIVGGAEHILVLIKQEAHDSAIHWLNLTFDQKSTGDYKDWRLIWYQVSQIAWMVLIIVVSPLIPKEKVNTGNIRHPWHRVGLLFSPFLASGVLALVNKIIPVSNLGGFLVGGATALWFFIMGLIWLLIGLRPPRLTRSHMLWGVFLFILLIAAVGMMGNLVMLNYLLVPTRLIRWPLMVLAYLPWLLAAGQVQQGTSVGKRVGWWLTQSVLLSAGLIFAVNLVPSLSVLILALPIFPMMFAIMAIGGAVFDHPWSSAMGNAMFFAWLMLAYFPIAG